MKRFCADIREHALNTINHEKKKMKPLTHKELEPFSNKNNCHTCGEEFGDNNDDDDDDDNNNNNNNNNNNDNNNDNHNNTGIYSSSSTNVRFLN